MRFCRGKLQFNGRRPPPINPDFKQIRSAVTPREAAERYGMKVSRNGMALCPFHEDTTPSLKFGKCYYCFACGAKGDSIDLTAKLLGLPPREAAIRLAEDFGIHPVKVPKKKTPAPKAQADRVESADQWIHSAVWLLLRYAPRFKLQAEKI